MRKLFCIFCLVCASVGWQGLAQAQVPHQTFKEERVTLPNGIVAQLRFPVTSESGRMPALLIFGGFQNAARVLDLVHPRVPVVLGSFDYPFSLPRKFKFPGSLRFAPEVKTMVHATLRGIDELGAYLRRRPEIDPERISILGASLGAPFAMAGAADTPHFAGLILVHGFAEVPLTAMHQLERVWGPRYGAISKIPAWLIGHLGWWYINAPSPEVLSGRLRSSQKVFSVRAEADQFVPKEARDALEESLKESKAETYLFQTPGDHLQPGSDALIEEILGKVTDWMDQVGLLGAKKGEKKPRSSTKSAASGL